MVVWLVFSLHPPYSGGAATYSDLLAAKLSDHESVDRTILLTEYHPQRPFVIRDARRLVLRILPRRDSIRKGNVFTRILPFLAWQFILAGVVFTVAILRRGHVLHLHNRFAYPWIGLLVKWLRCPAVVDVRDRFITPRWIAYFPRVIYVTQAIGQMVEKVIPGDRLHHIPVPLDLNEIERLGAMAPRHVKARDFFLFAGSLTESKGVMELLRGYQLFRKNSGAENKPVLVLAGPNGLNSTLPDDLLEDTVFLGPQSREAIYPLMKQARALILPSKSEGMPRVCLEAIVLGTPVLVPPDIPEFMQACPNNVIPSIDPESIAEALERLISNPIRADDYPISEHEASRCLSRTGSVYRMLQKA